jgi:hypothetical protein
MGRLFEWGGGRAKGFVSRNSWVYGMGKRKGLICARVTGKWAKDEGGRG